MAPNDNRSREVNYFFHFGFFNCIGVLCFLTQEKSKASCIICLLWHSCVVLH